RRGRPGLCHGRCRAAQHLFQGQHPARPLRGAGGPHRGDRPGGQACSSDRTLRGGVMATNPVTSEPGGLRRIPFTAAAEVQIKTLSFWLSLVGWLNVAAAVLALVNLVTTAGSVGHIANALVHALIGFWWLQAARAFKAVATTDVA